MATPKKDKFKYDLGPGGDPGYVAINVTGTLLGDKFYADELFDFLRDAATDFDFRWTELKGEEV